MKCQVPSSGTKIRTELFKILLLEYNAIGIQLKEFAMGGEAGERKLL